MFFSLFASSNTQTRLSTGTNTFPSWDRAQPSRMMCHNGEINTLRGNVNWMLAREATAISPTLGPHKTAALFPTCSDEYSDSGNLDSVLELLTQTSSMSMPEAILMLVPEAYQSKQGLHPDLKGLYVVFAVCQYVTHSYHHSYHKKSTLES